MNRKKSKTNRKKIYIIIGLFLAVCVGAILFLYWFVFYSSNVKLPKDKQFIYIHTGATYEMVLEELDKVVENKWSLGWAAQAMKYDELVKPGRYTIGNGMGNRELIQLLRSGKQEPVKITIQSHNRVGDIIRNIVTNLECDSETFVYELYHGKSMSNYHITSEKLFEIFIPNTYFVNWDIKPDSIIGRFANEYKRFWNSQRTSKLKSRGISRTEAVIIASLVARETNKADEMPIIAGVVFNRMQKNMNLEIDPTIKFALQDFSIKRIYNKHKEAASESPYNTYTHKGLPPGPICNPPIEAIDAVLNAQNHQYIFYCASETRLGYHNFAKTYSEHLVNARRYQNWLTANGY